MNICRLNRSSKVCLEKGLKKGFIKIEIFLIRGNPFKGELLEREEERERATNNR